MKYIYFWIPYYEGLQIRNNYRYNGYFGVRCPTGNKKTICLVNKNYYNYFNFLIAKEKTPMYYTKDYSVKRTRPYIDIIEDELVWIDDFINAPSLFPMQLKHECVDFRIRMHFRGQQWYAVIHEIPDKKKYTDPEKDIKYVLLPQFEIISWKDTGACPYMRQQKKVIIPPWGINKKYLKNKDTCRVLTRRGRRVLTCYSSDTDDDIDYFFYEKNPVSLRNMLRYRTSERKNVHKYRNWKFHTKYRKSWEKNIKNHIDTVSI